MGHMTEAKRPDAGKCDQRHLGGSEQRQGERGPMRPVRSRSATRRLFEEFQQHHAERGQPMVRRPQKYDTALAPVTCGSNP